MATAKEVMCARLRRRMVDPRAVDTRIAIQEYRRLGCTGGVSLKGLGALTTSKAEANSAYEATKRDRNDAEAALKAYASVVPEDVRQAFYAIDKWFWPNYEQFLSASEFSYGNWKEAALNAADKYRSVSSQIAAAAKAANKSPANAPKDNPDDKPKDNTMLIVGGVVAAVLVGYMLMPKGDAAR